MIETLYQTLEGIGYTHPLHPPMVHLPVGLILGAFLFLLIAQIFLRPGLAKTARHCMVLALISLIPAILLGLMDWQHRFGGVLQFPIIMKLILAGALLVLVCVSIVLGRQDEVRSLKHLVVYALCTLTVSGIGYFGGEIVYGKNSVQTSAEAGLVGEGAAVFQQKCAACHFSDKTDNKLGPGLKGLFKKQKMASSGLSVSESNIRAQLKTPFRAMPPFADLPQDKMDALIEYLKTL